MSRKISSAETFLNRFHPVIYISIAALVVALTVFLYYNVFLKAEDPSARAPSVVTSFDKTTIEQVKGLRTSEEAKGSVKLPDSRYNPFH